MFFPSSGGSRTVPSSGSGHTDGTPVPPNSLPGGDISGRFDPTALERGAKALRDLDSSPNAQKAFEVTKLHEQTRQKEIAKEMEQIQASRAQIQADRARVEGDEKRKTVSHQQEQERVTAQYKAQLEAEAYSKKLQDQQKQNEEWLTQQHQQFLRQEDIRKRNEKDLLDMKRQQMQEEKAIERDLIKARIQEEAKGRILQERENVDVHLREMRAKAAEDRKTKLEVVTSSLSSIGAAMNTLLEDKNKRNALIVGVSAIAVGVYGARAGTGIIGRQIRSWLGALNPWSKKANFQDKIVLPKDLSERLEWTANSLIAAKKNGTPFRHMLLHGHPGTGKTLLARTLARKSGLDYAIMTGGDVGPLGKDAVHEINKLFDWANHSKKGLILFVDEAEAFLRQGRGTTSGQISEELRNSLSAFLHHTGTESDKFCVILATNVKEILDRAVLDRIDEQFEFPLPCEEDRLKMVKMFFAEHLDTPTKTGLKIEVDPNINDEFFNLVARQTAGFSGRQLAKLVLGMQAAVFGSGGNTLTRSLAETVLNWKIAHFNEDVDTIDRTSSTAPTTFDSHLTIPKKKCPPLSY